MSDGSKTIGQIAHEAFAKQSPWPAKPWKHLMSEPQRNYEVMASAVWDQAVEACIQAIKDVEKELAAEGEVYILLKTVEALCSLKRSQSQTDTDDLCQAKSSTQGETVSREGALQATDGAEAMDHLGEVLSFFANLDEGDRCRAFEKAVVFYNKHNPNSQIQGEPGFTWHICQQGPLGFNCRRQIEEPANAGDEMTAASDGVSLTQINQDQDNG